MNWKKTKGQEEWVSGSFRIRKIFRYFKLWFSEKPINQFNTLDLAKKEAEKIIKSDE